MTNHRTMPNDRSMPNHCTMPALPLAALRTFSHLIIAVVTLSGLVLAAATVASSAERRPNILFIFSDDHALQAISAYGSKINQTPNIDRLARDGMLFRHCLVTNSICGPSRACILTGKYCHLNGFCRNGDRFDGSQQTFPKLLQQAGYQTALIGKWHLESDPTGYDHWQILPDQGAYYNPIMIRNGERLTVPGYTSELITELSLEWLEKQRDPARPFFLCTWHKAPHREWSPSLDKLDLYKDATIPEPATLFDDYSGRAAPAHDQDMTIAKTMTDADLKLKPAPRLTPEQLARWNAHFGPENEAFAKANLADRDLVRWKYQRYIKNYLRCVSSVDDSVGQLLDYLDRRGLADNTIVVYSSDQGFYLGEHGWFDKRWMYEESLHTPLLVRWPGLTRPGSENTQMVSNLDFAQTFLEAAAISAPADMQGASLVPLLKGQTPGDWRKSFYYHYYEFPGPHSVAKHYGVRTERYKLIRYYESDAWELFDLETDPHEMKSVYSDSSYAPIVAELKTELDRLRQQYQLPAQDPPARQRPAAENRNEKKNEKKNQKQAENKNA
jgi:arylsulfatase A-like enzyme